jgi:hypothetical protein
MILFFIIYFIFFVLACNTPAILSFDPFPNYRPSTIDTVTRQKREIVEENDEEDETKTKNDKIDLEKLRQQVDEVLHKVRIIDFVFFS